MEEDGEEKGRQEPLGRAQTYVAGLIDRLRRRRVSWQPMPQRLALPARKLVLTLLTALPD
jgi:hypothetical protein